MPERFVCNFLIFQNPCLCAVEARKGKSPPGGKKVKNEKKNESDV